MTCCRTLSRPSNPKSSLTLEIGLASQRNPRGRIPQNCCGDCWGGLPGNIGVLGRVVPGEGAGGVAIIELEDPILTPNGPNPRTPYTKYFTTFFTARPVCHLELNLGASSPKDFFKIGNASLFTKFLFTIFVALDPPPPNQQNDGFPLEFLLKGPQTELRTLSQNCEQTVQKLRTNRIMNKRAFLTKDYARHSQFLNLSGTGDSRESIRANHSQLKPQLL